MNREPSLYELVWGEPPPEPVEPEPEPYPVEPEAEPYYTEFEYDDPAAPPPPHPAPHSEERVRWRRGRPQQTSPRPPEVTPVRQPPSPAEPAPAVSVIGPAEPYLEQVSAEVEARISRAVEGLEDRIAHLQMSTLTAQSEARIMRALEALEGRLSRPAGSNIPDLVVLERVDQLEARVVNQLAELDRRLADASDRGEIELRLKNEVSEKLREVAAHLNTRLAGIHQEVVDKLDTYQAETARRIEQLEFRLRRRDAAFIEGLSGTGEPDS